MTHSELTRLLKNNIVALDLEKPFPIGNNTHSPIFCDFLRIPQCPDCPGIMREIRNSFMEKYLPQGIEAIVSRTASALPHAALLGDCLNVPYGYLPANREAATVLIADKKVICLETAFVAETAILSYAQTLYNHGVKELIIAPIFSYELRAPRIEMHSHKHRFEPLITIHDAYREIERELEESKKIRLTQWLDQNTLIPLAM